MIDVGTTFFSLIPEMDPSMMLKEEVFDGFKMHHRAKGENFSLKSTH